MIVDFHTHIFPPSFRRRRADCATRDATFGELYFNPSAKMATAEEVVAAMDAAGVDIAVAMGVGWTDPGLAREANDYIVQSVREFPGRLVGFCSVNPAWGADAVVEVERCAAAGLRGIGELHPDTQGFDLGSAQVMAPIMDAARGLELVVLVHSSEPVGHTYPGKGRTTPEKLYRLALNYPDNAIVCAHWGGGLPFYALMPEVAEALRGVYFDTAASPFLYRHEVFSTVAGLIGPDRVLFGTDFPLIKHSRLLRQVEEAHLDAESREKILGGNARTLLGL